MLPTNTKRNQDIVIEQPDMNVGIDAARALLMQLVAAPLGTNRENRGRTDF